MSLDRLAFGVFDIKTFSFEKREIEGIASTSGLDLGGDIVEIPGAFTKTIRERGPSSVDLRVNHDYAGLPIGSVVTLEERPGALHMRAKVYDTTAGDDLLKTVRSLRADGRDVGLSIGFYRRGSRMERRDGKSIRLLTDVDLREISVTTTPMNTETSITSVKTADAARMALAAIKRIHQGHMDSDAAPSKASEAEEMRLIDAAIAALTGVKALSEGSDTAGGFAVDADEGKAMDYTVEKRGDKFHVLGPDGQSTGSYDTEAAATTACDMHKAKGGKTVLPNTLPDAAFLHIQAGGVLDDEQKTVPRALRHFRAYGADGALDREALAAALAQTPQAKNIGLDAADLTRLRTRVRRLGAALDRGEKLAVEPGEWKSGIAVDLLGVVYRLTDAAERVGTEHKAMAVIGESTRGGWRMRAELQAELKAASDDLARIVGHAGLVAEGKDEEALADWWRAQFELIGVAS